MSFGTVQTNSVRTGTCPHGLPQGACPVCSGMGGGSLKKADFSAKPGEMSWNECAAIGAFLKAQKNAKMQRELDAQNYAKHAVAFQNAMMNASQKMAVLARFFAANTPALISKPINFVLNTVGGTFNLIGNFSQNTQNIFKTMGEKLADISDKLTAVYGELKLSVEKRLSGILNSIKKRIKSLFSIFNPQNADNDDKQIEETKKAFRLKTFLHDLYKKITKGNEKDIKENDN